MYVKNKKKKIYQNFSHNYSHFYNLKKAIHCLGVMILLLFSVFLGQMNMIKIHDDPMEA